MGGVLLPLLSYGASEGAITVEATWHLNQDGIGEGVPPAYIANFASSADEVLVANTSTSFNFTGSSPRSLPYPAGLTVAAGNNPVIVMTLAGGPAASNPTSITFGGQAMTMRHMTLPNEGDGFHLTVAMLAMRGGLPGSNTLTITWPQANGLGMRARMILLSQVSADSDGFGTGYEANNVEANAIGDFTLEMDSNSGDLVITGVFSNLANSTTGPSGFTSLGNSFLGDDPYNVAYRSTP